MADTGVDEFHMADDATLYEGMGRAAALRLPVAVHAENADITRRLAERARRTGKTGARDFRKSRPVIAEVEAIARALLFAEETGCSLHVVHVSSGRGVALKAQARAKGIDVSCETCPHYLVFGESDLASLGALSKFAPRLRSRAVRDELWECVLAGDVDMLASDHSPAPVSLRQPDDFFAAWGGIAGCQSRTVALMTEGRPRGLEITRLMDLVAEAPAARFRVKQRKGSIELGKDADLVRIDCNATSRLREFDLYYSHPHSPYVGRRASGRIVRTILREGRSIVKAGSSPEYTANSCDLTSTIGR